MWLRCSEIPETTHNPGLLWGGALQLVYSFLVIITWCKVS